MADSLVEALPKGTQIVGASGIMTDGTSRAYAGPSGGPGRRPAQSRAGHRRATADPACTGAATAVDALYRETPDDLRRWLGLGVEAINMEISPLYAAAAVCGVRSVWLGHVSDTLSLTTRQWVSWQRPAAMTDITIALTVALLETLCASADLLAT